MVLPNTNYVQSIGILDFRFHRNLVESFDDRILGSEREDQIEPIIYSSYGSPDLISRTLESRALIRGRLLLTDNLIREHIIEQRRKRPV